MGRRQGCRLSPRVSRSEICQFLRQDCLWTARGLPLVWEDGGRDPGLTEGVMITERQHEDLDPKAEEGPHV